MGSLARRRRSRAEARGWADCLARGSPRWTGPVPMPVALLAQHLQLRDRLEVLGPAGSALGADERLQVQEPELDAEDRDGSGLGDQGLVAPAPGDFTQEVEVPERRGEG